MRNFFLTSSFQHSSIPLFHVRGNTQQPEKTLLISINCRNSDISNYWSVPTWMTCYQKQTETKHLKDEDKEGGKRVVSWLTLQAEPGWLVNIDLDYSKKKMLNKER